MSSSNFQNASQSGQHDRMSSSSRKAGDWIDKGSYKMQNTPCFIQPRNIQGRNKTWPKGDAGLGKHESEVVLRMTGVFVQPGSGKILKFRLAKNKGIILVLVVLGSVSAFSS